jgi:hypothetical protein
MSDAWGSWAKRIEEQQAQILSELRALRAVQSKPSSDAATDADLDSQWGDPSVRKDPKRWTGESYEGKRYSECPPAYLLALADLLLWQAGKDEASGDATKMKYVGYKRKDAARAIGWAKRLESGWRPPASSAPDPEGW